MPRKNLSLPEVPEVVITLAEGDTERKYRLVNQDMDVEDALVVHGEAIDRVMAGNPTPLERTQVLAEQLNTLLEPVDGKQKTACDVLMAAYKAKEVTSAQIRTLIDNLMAEARPT